MHLITPNNYLIRMLTANALKNFIKNQAKMEATNYS
jgi:hypothetical protein